MGQQLLQGQTAGQRGDSRRAIAFTEIFLDIFGLSLCAQLRGQLDFDF